MVNTHLATAPLYKILRELMARRACPKDLPDLLEGHWRQLLHHLAHVARTAHVDPVKPFSLYTDPSDVGLGCYLAQQATQG